MAGRLLENDEGQGEDEADMQTRTQHTGVLKSGNVIKHSLRYYKRLNKLRQVCIKCESVHVDSQPQ